MEQYEEDSLDLIYEEMYNWSGLDTVFVFDILNAAEEDDIAYELVLKWFRAESPKAKLAQESYMSQLIHFGRLIK